ncbi:MAG: FkbM family methyltransferase [Spirochaetes bacterium]|nr:FkbM family methyltransferase [Spirochaetota bacterium]
MGFLELFYKETIDKGGISLKYYRIKGRKIGVYDYATSSSRDHIVRELKTNTYGFNHLVFKPGDKVIDIGANVGIVSMCLALKYPFLEIFAYEPIPENYNNFLKSIELNNITNIKVFNKAVTGDGRKLKMIAQLSGNTGGATAQVKNVANDIPHHNYYEIDSLTLDEVFTDNSIDKCKLLKIDCEGSEYEILFSTNKLGSIEYMSGEFHINDNLKEKGYSAEKLVEHCAAFIDSKKIHYYVRKMAE